MAVPTLMTEFCQVIDIYRVWIPSRLSLDRNLARLRESFGAIARLLWNHPKLALQKPLAVAYSV